MSIQSSINELTSSILIGAAGVGHTLGKKTEALAEINEKILQNDEALANTESDISNLNTQQTEGMPEPKNGKYRDSKGKFTTKEKAQLE